MPLLTRRALASLAGVLAALAATRAAARLAPTPEQTEGPFYPDKLPLDQDNDLLVLSGGDAADGAPLDLTGDVVDTDGRPLAGVLVEIWQCDARGNYLHSEGSAGTRRDAAFQGYGRATTDASGRWRFRTIRPVAYPGRTPHIHFAVHGPKGVLTTQMYVAGERANARDFLWRALSAEGRRAASAELSRDGAGWRGEWRVVLG